MCCLSPDYSSVSISISSISSTLAGNSFLFFSPMHRITIHAVKQLTDDALSDAISNGLYDKALENAKTLLSSFIYQVCPSDQYSIVFSEAAKE